MIATGEGISASVDSAVVSPARRRGGRDALAARPSVRGGHGTVFAGLVAGYLSVVGAVLVWGGSYYVTDISARRLHSLHSLLRPGGVIGHSLGVLGTLMMLAIFGYSLRKRWEPLQRIGTQAQWLKVHIFLGIAGPVAVTLHTTGKLGGLISVAFYSMWAMALSGVVGRYLYAKIPRTVEGNRMSLKEIEERLTELVESLRRTEHRQKVLEKIEAFLARTRREQGGLVRALVRGARDDLRLPGDALRIWRILGTGRSLSSAQRFRITGLVLRQQRILNHLAVLDATQRLFSFWHVFHKPFTVLTFVIVFLHVALVLYLGYGFRW